MIAKFVWKTMHHSDSVYAVRMMRQNTFGVIYIYSEDMISLTIGLFFFTASYHVLHFFPP